LLMMILYGATHQYDTKISPSLETPFTTDGSQLQVTIAVDELEAGLW